MVSLEALANKVLLGPRVGKIVLKNRVPGLPDGKSRVILRSLVLIQYLSVTD